MIRETFDPSATAAYTADYNNYGERIGCQHGSRTGRSASEQDGLNSTAPCWGNMAPRRLWNRLN